MLSGSIRVLSRLIRPAGGSFRVIAGVTIGRYATARILTWIAVFSWGWKEWNPTQFMLFKSYGLLGAAFDVAAFFVILGLIPLAIRKVGDWLVTSPLKLSRISGILLYCMIWLWFVAWILVLFPDAVNDALTVLGILPHQMA